MQHGKNPKLTVLKPVFVGSNQNEGSLFLIILGIKTPLDNPIFGLLSTSTFTCPSDIAAKNRGANNVKNWRYYYAGRFPNQDIGPACVVLVQTCCIERKILTRLVREHSTDQKYQWSSDQPSTNKFTTAKRRKEISVFQIHQNRRNSSSL
jgi:hypothetical protein